MTKESTITKSRRVLRKVIKALSFGIALVIAVLIVAHFAWKYSGSSKWELELDKNGIKVYSLKSPGSTLKQVKGVTQIKTRLNRIVAAMTNSSTEGCRKWDANCTAGEVLEPWNPETLRMIQYFRSDFPRPFSPRDLVLKTQVSQDPQSKVVLVQVTALSDRLPPNPCCLRVTHVNNTWQYTPLENGEIEVEFVGDYDFGIPYFMFNRLVPQNLYDLLSQVGKIFNDEEYQRAEFAFLKEP
jgi:hypothetical protein